jgi:hypothetical protein
MGKADGNQERDLNAICMKVTIAKTKNMAMVYSLGQVEIFTKENIKKMKGMDMEK